MATSSRASKRIVLLGVRLSYFYGFQPFKSTNEQGQTTANYCSHGIFDRGSSQAQLVQKTIREVAQIAWPREYEQILKQLVAKDRLCMHNGDVNKPNEEAYKGKLYVSANSKSRPQIVDGARNPLTEASGIPYSGCIANLIVDIWAQKGKSFGTRINAGLAGVQFVAHGEPLSAARIANPEEFPMEATEADGESPGASDVDDLGL